MSDKLKQFIEENREAFDSESPDPQLLKKLKKQLGQGSGSKKFYGILSMRWAAAVAGFILLSVIIYYAVQKKDNNRDIATEPTENVNEVTGISDPVYAKQIDQYKELIGLQQVQLKQIGKEQPELYRRFATDINSLDSAYTLLKRKLSENPNKELLLEAMIQNLQLQTDLLNRQLIIIKEVKQKSKT